MSLRIVHIQRMEKVSGSEKYIADLAKAQKANGSEVLVIIVASKVHKSNLTAFISELEENEVEVKLILTNSLLSISLLKELNSIISKFKSDILHTHLLHADIYAVLINKLFRRDHTIISTKHGFEEVYLYQNGFEVKKIPYTSRFYWLSRIVEKGIDQSYAVSKSMSKFFFDLKITEKQIPYIYHGLTEEYINFANTLVNSVSQNTTSGLSLLIVGRLVPYKGHVYLFQALKEIKKEITNVSLIVVGKGEYDKELEKLTQDLDIQENVIFTGFQQNPHDFYKEADIVVIPSLVEPFGLVFIEAFAFKKPVVCFDVPAGNEIVKNDINGLLVSAKDSLALAKALLSLIHDEAKRRKIGNAAYQTLKKDFSFSNVIENVNNLYLKALDKQ